MEYVQVPEVFKKYRFDEYYKKDLPIDNFREKVSWFITTKTDYIL